MATMSSEPYRFTSFEKVKWLRGVIEERSKPPSEGIWHKGPGCSFVVHLDKDHLFNCQQLRAGLIAADQAREKTFSERKRDNFSQRQLQPRPINLGSEMPISKSCPSMVYRPEGSTGSVVVEEFSTLQEAAYRTKILAHRAEIAVLSNVLLDEIDWMKGVRCSLKDLRAHMPEDVIHEQDKSHLHELIYHIDRVVTESERGLAVEVSDKGFS